MDRGKGRDPASATQRFVEVLEARTLLAGVLLKDINTATASSSPSAITALGSSVLFFADDGVHGRELWSLASGVATRVTDFSPTTTTGALVRMNQFVYFIVKDVSGVKIWRSDGTIANTGPITNILTSGSVGNLAVAGGKLFFTTFDTTNGTRLWFTTDAGPGSEQVVKQL